VYFNVTVHDLDTTRAFFQDLFAWKFEGYPMPYPAGTGFDAFHPAHHTTAREAGTPPAVV
jgi:predicted enzyme related to lactoylglutathione lyase